MRQVVLDTETTGLDASKGHRIIEIGCIELSERRATGRSFQRYLNPQRLIDEGAMAVHGISNESLVDKPLFRDIVDELLAFIDGAEVLAHNARFDVSFLDAELAIAGSQYGRIGDRVTVIDTLSMARELYPGQRNGLDALCKRLGVDNSHRELHGALLDAQLLAEVYIGMTAGQGDLGLANNAASDQRAPIQRPSSAGQLRLRIVRANEAEQTAHRQRIAALDNAVKGESVWTQLGWG